MTSGSDEPVKDIAPRAGNDMRILMDIENRSETLRPESALQSASVLDPSHAVTKLELENARLRALLLQAGVDARDIAVATSEATLVASAETRELVAIVAFSSDAIISKKLDNTITSWNAAAERLFGYTPEEMLGRSFLTLIPPERHTDEASVLARVAAGEIVQAFETVLVDQSGQSIEVSVTTSPLFDENGEICGASKIVRDITERKQNEARLRSSEEFARTVLEASPDCLKVIGSDGAMDYLNQNGACLLELDSPRSVLGQQWESLWPDISRPVIGQAIETARSGQPVIFTLEAPTAKGTPKIWEVSITAIPAEKGEPVRLLAASRDVSEKTRAADRLVESEARFRAAIDAVDGIVWTNNAAGEMTGEQPAWSALTGHTRAEYEGFGWSKAVHPDDAEPTLDAWQAAIATKSLFEFEHRVRCHDGEWRHFSIRAAPIFDKDGHIVEWVGVHRDISAQKSSEAHRELLMRELAHRSKNQLAVIQGVAGLTARHASSLDEFRKTFGKRLHGMAISTDLLVSQDWEGAPLGELVRQQLEPFGTDNGRLMCEGPHILLSSDAAETIGLALHELATNCVKYGSWSVPSGVVKVAWELVREHAQPIHFRVSWTESGGPAVIAPQREGFGRRVIEGMVAQKLHGTVELDFDVKGLNWTLTAPLDSAVL